MASSPNTDLVLVGPVKMGRPSLYTDELALEICERITVGESLNRICEDDHMPARITVVKWLLDGKHKEFLSNYATARQMQADAFADEIHDIADDLRLLPDHKRVMIDARKWRAARQNWRAWGDKVTHEHSHNVAAPPLKPGSLPPSLKFLDSESGGDGD